MVRGSRSGRWLLKDRRRPQLDGESLADHYQREANPLPRPRKRPARRRPIETVSNGTQSNFIRAVAILSALVTAMTEAELLDAVIERAADRALELMGQGRASACEAPAI